AIAEFPHQFVGRLFGGPVPQWIHANAHRQSRERIVILRPRQHRTLIAQPPQVAQKHQYQEHSGAGRNADLRLSKGHRPSLEPAMGGTRLPPAIHLYMSSRAGSSGKKRHSAMPCLRDPLIKELLFFVFLVLGWLNSAILRSLGLSFFHRLLGFRRLLGASFSTFLPLLVKHLFAAEEFEECFVSAVALIPRGPNDARVAAITIAESRSDG